VVPRGHAKCDRPIDLGRRRGYGSTMSTAAQRPRLVRVPFVDLGPSHEDLKGGLLADFAELIETGAFTNGPQVAEFEAAFASFCRASHCVGLASGLDALRLALVACGIEPGDEVILPANTFVATAEAVTQAGGTPVLADVGETDYNLDPEAVATAIGARTRFVLPVHLYGQLADMRALTALAKRHELQIVEDACQAHGARRGSFTAGSAGAASAFSFYPGKNLGAFGDAGALITDSEEVDVCVRALREHGQRAKYEHELIGWTARLDTIQAIVLLQKLPHLTQWNEERHAAAAYYLERLAGAGDLVLPPIAAGSAPVWHLFVIRTADPASLAAHLGERGIGTGRHYPQPIHLTAAYAPLGKPEGSFPVTEALARECLSLPIFAGISEEQLDAVCCAAESYFARG
jgi:dTDP-4-amino-4,6-dideoxygalactose transaminase